MQNNTKEDELMARYLLGRLTEQEQSAIEERFFADDEFFERMLEVEEDLIDEYLRDELPASDRERMEELLRSSRRQRHELEFNRALAHDVSKVLAQTKKPVQVEPNLAGASDLGRRRFTSPLGGFTSATRLAFAAALLLAALIVPLLVWSLTLKSDIRNLRMERAQLKTSDEELREEIARQNEELEQMKRQLDDEQKKRQELDKKLSQLQRAVVPSPPPSAEPLFLSADSISRESSQLSSIRIRPGARQLRLKLELGPDDSFKYYGITIKTFGGQKILDMDVIRAARDESGNLALSIPANSLRRGDYILTLKGRRGDEPYTEIRDYALSVKR